MAGFARSYTPQFGGLYKTPAGKTQASAGAGGAVPHAQAPAFAGSQDQGLDASRLAGLGGLLFLMGQDDKPASMTFDHREASPEYVAEQVGRMTPEDRAAMESSPFSVDWRQAYPRFWDEVGNEIFPNEGLLGALGRKIGSW